MSNREFLRALYVGDILRAEDSAPRVATCAQAAFDGDSEAALELFCGLRNHNRGAVAVMMWRGGVEREAFRTYFASAWDHDHLYVIRAAKTRRTLAAMFRYAAFPKPPNLPERVTVWRGTSKLKQREAARGYSWSLDRDTACWFAMRFADANGSPLVLRAEVDAIDVALFHDERSEREAVLMRPPVAIVCGDMADWQAGHTRYETAKNERERAMRAQPA